MYNAQGCTRLYCRHAHTYTQQQQLDVVLSHSVRARGDVRTEEEHVPQYTRLCCGKQQRLPVCSRVAARGRANDALQ
jgi:hypothetical protein